MNERTKTIGKFLIESNNFLEKIKNNSNSEENLTIMRIIEGYKIIFGLFAGNNTDEKYQQLNKITNTINNNQ